MANVLFKFGNQAAYDALATGAGYDTNSLYFIEDTARLYKGSVLMSQQTSFVTAVPEFASAKSGIIYVVTTSGSVTLYVKGETEMLQAGGGTVQPGAITNLNVFNDSLITKTGADLPADDSTIPTSGAVKAAIETAVKAVSDKVEALGDPVTGATSSRSETNDGTVITLTRASGENPITVTVSDLFLTSAEYDAQSHMLKLFVKDVTDPVEVDLGALMPQVVTSTQVAMDYGTPGVLTATVNVGNIKAGDKISLTDGEGNVKADTVQAMFAAILSKDINPTTTQPSASVTLTGAGAKEVGTSFTPSFKASLNPGSYNVQGQSAQATGVTPTAYSITDTNSNTATTASGNFDAFTVEDNTNYTVSATIEYGDGNMPKTFLGNDYPAGQITAGSKSATSAKVTGFRNRFWGYKTAEFDVSTITDENARTFVEGLQQKGSTKPTSYNNIPAGMVQLFFAVPATDGNISEITQSNPVAPVTVRGPINVNIGGVGNHSPIPYKIFYTQDGATIAAQNYTIKW